MLSRRRRFELIKQAQRLSSHLPGLWDRRIREAGKMLLNYQGARSTVLRTTLFPLLGRHTRLLVAPFGNGEMLVESEDEELGRIVFIRGEYERKYMSKAMEYLTERGFSAEGKIFIDVGANIGSSTLDALLHFGFSGAVCFEPDSRAFRLLRMNMILNDVDSVVTTFLKALSDSEGPALLNRSEGTYADSRLLKSPMTSSLHESEDPRAVDCVTLDSLIDRGEIELERLGLLWVDTQGHEPFVLRGARKLSGAGIPAVVEYWPSELLATDSISSFEESVQDYRVIVDLRALCNGYEEQATVRASDISLLRSRYEGREHTDLLLVG